ncbi:MAG: hypothetical protein JGK28_29960 [Microcoleus sp. PH2017_07_MST_O_A]|nr:MULTISPECIES: hypothetical protein [unclassified Microcoleus]MCC3421999.1 hypothetical protein [Microcoleus sp. PH2017_07_MST_O_A]MCC3511278.1 hypothetical protein [Microcoleus sp. PH2017_17_BER_D_A]MCC3448906.1 hypothetical protein [Microcoleus sp. PH2017_09_SFU_O_A]MCC3457602.1 hypothetical protein [Microcoleus sp. PH2017_08_TRC_O_A]MCC3517205.1 hypothetical protein [Microcoleus sp. PH2017_18_LLB_O_A]
MPDSNLQKRNAIVQKYANKFVRSAIFVVVNILDNRRKFISEVEAIF